MNSTDLLNRFRVDVSDVATPYLWGDEEIYQNIDDAQKMFCRLTGGIPDASTAAVTRIAYTAGTASIPLHTSILKIRDVYFLSDGKSLSVKNYEDLQEAGFRLDGRQGRPYYLVIGMEADKALLYPTPTADDTLCLLVDRLPIKPITDAGDQKLEVQEEHHLHLLHWVKHLAYSKQDAETFDKKASDDYEAKFRVYCAAAKAEKDRAKHKTRMVRYGGI